MTVNSYLELHTTLLAWTLYGIIWDVFLVLGLVGLPLVWLLVKTGVMSLGRLYEGHEDTAGLIRQVIGIVLVVMLFLVPVWPVNPTDVQYQPPPDHSGHHPPAVNPVTTPTTYGLNFTSASVRIPTGWYLVYAFSQGVSQAVKDALPARSDLRLLQSTVQSRNIRDPGLAADYNDFVHGCYFPAMANYQKLTRAGIMAPAPPDQPLWSGHEYLVTTPGLYAHCPSGPGGNLCRADAPDPLHIQRDHALVTRVGGDSCAHWWGNLRPRLLAEARSDQNAFARSMESLGRAFGVQADREKEDILISAMLQNHRRRGALSGTTEEHSSSLLNRLSLQGAADLVKDVVNTGLLGTIWVLAELALGAIKQAMPVLLAMAMLFLVLFIPFMMLFTAFSVGAVVRLCFWMFSIVFFHTLLAVAGWLDNVLIASMFEGEKAWSFLGDAFGQEDVTQKKLIINLILVANYSILPLFWFTLMGSVGSIAAAGASSLLGAGSGIGSQMTGAIGQTSGIGKAGAGMVRGAGSAVAKAAPAAGKAAGTVAKTYRY